MQKFKAATFVLLLSPLFNYAQDSTVVSDFELWTGLKVEKSFLEKKLDLALTQEFRFKDNATSINNYFTEFGGSYEIFHGFNLGLGYRFIRNKTKKGYENHGRVYADVSYKHKIDRFTLAYRFRYQNQNEIGVSRDEGDYARTKYRLRVKAAYNIKKWKLDPYISGEVFYTHTLNQITYIESIEEEADRINSFEKFRFTLGTQYKINKWMEAGAFYRFERELKSYPLFYNTPASYYIAGINLTFKL